MGVWKSGPKSHLTTCPAVALAKADASPVKNPRTPDNLKMNQPGHSLPPSSRLRRDKYDQSVAIRPQNTMPVWETSQKPYDAKSAVFTISNKCVTRDGATPADSTKHISTCARSCLSHLSDSEPILAALAVVTVLPVTTAGTAHGRDTPIKKQFVPAA